LEPCFQSIKMFFVSWHLSVPTTQKTRNSFKMMNQCTKVPALFTRNPSQSSWHAECGAAVISIFLFCSCFRRLAGSGIATKEFGKKNLTMLAVPQTSLHGGATTTWTVGKADTIPLDQDFRSLNLLFFVWIWAFLVLQWRVHDVQFSASTCSFLHSFL